MKIRLFLALLFMPILIFAQDLSQVQEWDSYDVGWWSTFEDTNMTITKHGIQDDSVKIEYWLDASDRRAWPMIIENKSNSVITVKWMKSQINGDRITFEEIPISNINNEIPDDVIYPNNKLFKKVTSVYWVSNNLARPFKLQEAKKKFKKSHLPQFGKVDIIICLGIGDEEKVYRFTMNAVYNGKRK